MTLKYLISKLDEVAETVRNLYKPEGDKFVLDVEGAVERSRLDEFRENNIRLQQAFDKLKDVDPVKYAELIKLDKQVQEKQLIDAGKVDEVVNLRVNEMRTAHETERTELSTKLTKAEAALQVLLIDNQVKTAAIKYGVLPSAVDDVVLRARGTYVVENNTPTPKDPNGKVIYGKDGSTPMSIDDWVQGLKKSANHLFHGSRGGGAGGGNGSSGVDFTKMTPAQKIAYGLNQGAGPLQGSLPGESS